MLTNQAIALRRPLLPVRAVMCILDCSEDRVMRLTESGELQFVFDLATRDARRREVRVYSGSVYSYANRSGQRLRPTHDDIRLARAISACIPPGDGPIRLSDLARSWTISSTHAHDLARSGELSLLPSQNHKAKQSPFIDRQSAQRFLAGRRVN